MLYADIEMLKKLIRENAYFLKDELNSTEKGMFISGIEQAIDEATKELPNDLVRKSEAIDICCAVDATRPSKRSEKLFKCMDGIMELRTFPL